jgi:hypothetical protein
MVLKSIVAAILGGVPYMRLQGKATVKLQQSYFSMGLMVTVAAILGGVPYIWLQGKATVKLQQFYFSKGLK